MDKQCILHVSELDLDQAEVLVRGSDLDLPPHQGHLLFQRLLGLKSRRVKLKIASSLNDCAELQALAAHGEPACHIFNL